MIELYAITDADGPPLPDVAALRSAATRGLAGVYGPAAVGDVTPEALWRHAQVVEAVIADRDALPVRFGTRVDSEATILAALEQNHNRLSKSLEFVRGAAEVSVRAYATERRPSEPDRDVPRTGTQYIRGRARELAAERDAVRAIHEPLAAQARAACLWRTAAPEEMIRGAYLVDRSAVPRFGRLVTALHDGSPALQLICTGPWPPYSFAER